MKTKFFYFLAIFSFVSSVRSQDCGKVIIHNAYGTYPYFIVSMNGIRTTNTYSSTIEFNCLDEFNYKLKVLQTGTSNMLSFNISSEPRYLSKFVINKDKFGTYSLILESKSLIMDEPEMPETQTNTTAPTVVPTNTRVVRMPTAQPSGQQLAAPAAAINTNTVASTSVTITNISKAEFDERLAAVKKVSFDDKRLARAKQVFDDEYLTTNQVIEVVKAFSFDDSKLDFAKWAYKNTMDKKNYYKVEDNFSFGSSKTNLADWIKKQPK